MFKELFEAKHLVFTTNYKNLDQMMDDMKLSYPIEQKDSNTWVSVNPLGPAHQRILKKEIESQLDKDLKKNKSYSFSEK
jgi:hypothetical protein